MLTGENVLLSYDGANVVEEREATNSAVVKRRYVHGPGTDEPLVWYELGSTSSLRRWFHQDERGSVVATSTESGALHRRYTYDEYGIPASTNAGRFQYTGQLWLPTLGMYSFKARIYSPTLGRFLQTDPIGYSDQMNLYAYVGNDPVGMIDPNGLCGYRYDDGTCRVKVQDSTGAAGIEAGRKLEARLNLYDREVNRIKNNATIQILDKAGKVTGTMSGREFKAVWNNTGFRVVGDVQNNGSKAGAEGGTVGRWNSDGSFSNGTAKLTPGAVADWEERGVKANTTAEAGLDTLIFHELAHNTNRGREEQELHEAHAGAYHAEDWQREWRTSSAGNAALTAVKGAYVCAASGCD